MVRFFSNGKYIKSIEVPLTEIGGTSTVSYTIENDSEEHIKLIPYVHDKDVTIQEYPKELGPRETGVATWVFTPKPERLKEERRSLNTTCGFKEIIG